MVEVAFFAMLSSIASNCFSPNMFNIILPPRLFSIFIRLRKLSLIDTMFFLLVFFMIATLSMTLQQGIPVNLPASSTATDDMPNDVSLTLTDNGKLFFNKEPMSSVQEIAPRLQNLRREPSVVINAVRQTGITAMAIATDNSMQHST